MAETFEQFLERKGKGDAFLTNEETAALRKEFNQSKNKPQAKTPTKKKPRKRKPRSGTRGTRSLDPNNNRSAFGPAATETWQGKDRPKLNLGRGGGPPSIPPPVPFVVNPIDTASPSVPAFPDESDAERIARQTAQAGAGAEMNRRKAAAERLYLQREAREAELRNEARARMDPMHGKNYAANAGPAARLARGVKPGVIESGLDRPPTGRIPYASNVPGGRMNKETILRLFGGHALGELTDEEILEVQKLFEKQHPGGLGTAASRSQGKLGALRAKAEQLIQRKRAEAAGALGDKKAKLDRASVAFEADNPDWRETNELRHPRTSENLKRDAQSIYSRAVGGLKDSVRKHPLRYVGGGAGALGLLALIMAASGDDDTEDRSLDGSVQEAFEAAVASGEWDPAIDGGIEEFRRSLIGW